MAWKWRPAMQFQAAVQVADEIRGHSKQRNAPAEAWWELDLGYTALRNSRSSFCWSSCWRISPWALCLSGPFNLWSGKTLACREKTVPSTRFVNFELCFKAVEVYQPRSSSQVSMVEWLYAHEWVRRMKYFTIFSEHCPPGWKRSHLALLSNKLLAWL